MTKDFYREEIMEHFKSPNNKGHLSSPSTHVREVNPMCGDEVDLELKIVDGKIEDIAFDGQACSVSVVSSSFLTEFVKGKSLEEAKKVNKEDLLGMLDLNLSTSRVKCATLIIDALNHAIENYEKTN